MREKNIGRIVKGIASHSTDKNDSIKACGRKDKQSFNVAIIYFLMKIVNSTIYIFIYFLMKIVNSTMILSLSVGKWAPFKTHSFYDIITQLNVL